MQGINYSPLAKRSYASPRKSYRQLSRPCISNNLITIKNFWVHIYFAHFVTLLLFHTCVKEVQLLATHTVLSNSLKRLFISHQKVLLASSGPLQGVSALSLVFTVVLVTDVLLQLDHVSGTTYLPVCEIRKSAAQNSEDNWKHSCLKQTAAHRDFSITAPYKYSYLLNYFWTTVTLFTYVVKISLLLCMSFVSLMFQRLLAIAFVFHIAFISGTTDMRDKEIGAPTSRYTELWTNFKMACSLLWPRMSLTSDLERVTISER